MKIRIFILNLIGAMVISCSNQKFAIYTGQVKDEFENPISNVRIAVLENGELSMERPDTLSKEIIEKINEEMYRPIYQSDSNGKFRAVIKQTMSKNTKLCLVFQKPSYLSETIHLEWIAKLDTIIILKKVSRE